MAYSIILVGDRPTVVHTDAHFESKANPTNPKGSESKAKGVRDI